LIIFAKTKQMLQDSLSDNLKRIKELSGTLQTLPALAHIEGSIVYYEMKSGECRGEGLFKNSKIAVQHATLSKGSDLEAHIHNGIREFLICYEGDLTIVVKEPEDRIIKTIIYTGGMVIIDPGIPHLVSSIGGCKLIAVTIPAEEGYPAGK